MSDQSPLVRRMRAAESAVSKFSGQPLAWGRTDCVRMAAFVLKELDHKVSLMGLGRYSTELGALRALKRQGHDRLDTAVDALGLPRIAPAMALPGDIVGFETDRNGWVALGVCLGLRRVLGFYGDPAVCQVVEPLAVATAWAVL